MSRHDPGGRQPIEESPEVAAAVDDDAAAPQFATEGGPDEPAPEFTAPGDVAPDRPATDELIGDAFGAGSPGGAARTGAEQPWDPEDLARAKGQDPSPKRVARARREWETDGPAAVERTVP